MMSDLPQGQTHHCPLCEQANQRIFELEKLLRKGLELFEDGQSDFHDETAWVKAVRYIVPKK